jgi:hypothetical protein
MWLKQINDEESNLPFAAKSPTSAFEWSFSDAICRL